MSNFKSKSLVKIILVNTVLFLSFFSETGLSGIIGVVNVDGVDFEVSFEGAGKVPPSNQLISLKIERSLDRQMRLNAGVKVEQENSTITGASEGVQEPLKEKTEDIKNNVAEKLTNKVQGNPQNIALVSFDAVMPEHKHGMFVKPVISYLKSGATQIDGVKLHMKGLWEFRFEWKVGEKIVKSNFPLNI